MGLEPRHWLHTSQAHGMRLHTFIASNVKVRLVKPNI